MPRRSAVVLTLLCASALVISACGGGGGAAPPETINPSVRDQLAADVAVVQVTDLPDTFAPKSATDSDSVSSDEAGQASPEVDKCIRAVAGTDESTLANARTATAKRVFNNGVRQELVTVEGRVEMYKDATLPKQQMAGLSQASVSACIKKVFVDVFTRTNANVDRIAVHTQKIDGVGDESAGFVVSGPATTADGVDIAFGGEFHIARVGRVLVWTYLFSLQVTPDHALAVSTIKAMTHRVQQ